MSELERFRSRDIGESKPVLSRGILPEALLAIALISPEREKAISTYVERIDARQQQRAEEFQQEVLKATDLSQEELLQLLLDDDSANELFGQAVMKAIHTADELKRHAMARAVASGLLLNDDALMDVANLHMRTIAALEVAHIRILLVFAQLQEETQGSAKQGGFPIPTIKYEDLESRLKWTGGAFWPLIGELSSRGLIAVPSSSSTGYNLTPFGTSLIEFLRENEQPAWVPRLP
jgi:hypothetical protein